MSTQTTLSASARERLMTEVNIKSSSLLIAAVRTAESKQPSPLFVDEFAETLVSEGAMRLFVSMKRPPKDMLAVRTRFFDDQILDAADMGFRQFVALGTGMDTRPLRQLSLPPRSLPSDIRWFEVDFPDVFEYKEAKLKDAKPRVHLERMSLDILNPELFNLLQDHGFNKNEKTFFVMEGVMSYLPDEQLDLVIGNLGREAARGSRLLIDIFGRSDMIPSLVAKSEEEISRLLNLMKFSGTGRQPPFKLFEKHGFVNALMTFSGQEMAHYGRFSFSPVKDLVIPPDLVPEWFALYTLDKDMLAAKR